MPGGSGTSKGRKAVYFSLVSLLDPCPDPRYKSYIHTKNHHDRLFVLDLDAKQNSLEFYQTANGSVLCHDTVPSEFLKEIISLQDGSERFGKEENKKGVFTRKSRCDHGQPRETSCRNTKQETIEPGQLRANSSTAEIIKRAKNSEVHAQCNYCPKKTQIGNSFLQMWKNLGGLTALQETNARVTIERGSQII